MLGVSRSLLAKLAPAAFYESLTKRGHDAFFGVPDSLLKDFCAYVTDKSVSGRHVITANEGNAVAMAAGYHMSTGKVPIVYLQNSGVGNTLNPLLSLTHSEVCKIPMLMLIGWRGDPQGKKDEPQHVAQGRLMQENLQAAEVPFSVIEPNATVAEDAVKALDAAKAHFAKHGTPYAVLIKRDTFDKYKLTNIPAQHKENASLEMSREEAIDTVMQSLTEKDFIVGTTGMPSREVFECRVRRGQSHDRDFLTVGCMGHGSSIAVGISLGMKPGDGRNVFMIDGDGAALMHLGALPINGALGADGHLRNFKHVVVNNAAHDSVGGQPTVGMSASLTQIAAASGYKVVRPEAVATKEELAKAVAELRGTEGPAFLEVHVRTGNRADLGRPTRTPEVNKNKFAHLLQHE
jgi:phosphonopyruvate decarboxylase